MARIGRATPFIINPTVRSKAMNLCPYCKKPISEAEAEGMLLRKGKGDKLKGMVVKCPHCSSILSITVDPYALVEQIRGKRALG